MEVFGLIFSKTMQIMTMPFEIFGFTLSLWNVFAFVFVADIVGWVIGEVVLGD